MRSPHAYTVLPIPAIALGLVLPQAAHSAPPVAAFTYSPPSPLSGESVTFLSVSTGTITSQTWDLDGDGDCDDANGATSQRSFPIAGEYLVRLCSSPSPAA